MRIKTIRTLGNFVLKIDGEDGLFDVKPYLQSEAFQRSKQTNVLRHIATFAKTRRISPFGIVFKAQF